MSSHPNDDDSSEDGGRPLVPLATVLQRTEPGNPARASASIAAASHAEVTGRVTRRTEAARRAEANARTGTTGHVRSTSRPDEVIPEVEPIDDPERAEQAELTTVDPTTQQSGPDIAPHNENASLHFDELLRSIMDRLDRQEAANNERFEALAAAHNSSHDDVEHARSTDATERPAGRPSSTQADTVTPVQDLVEVHDDTSQRKSNIEGLREELRKMTSRVHKATSAAPELERVLEETQQSPFSSKITNVQLRKVGKIKLASYEGTTDPRQFLTAFGIAIGRAHFSPGEKDAGSCQLFVEHLSGAALSWFSRLKPNTIETFQQLSAAFLKHYSMFIEKSASNTDLWTMSQGPKESLRTFIGRFKAVVSKIVIADDAAIAALKNAVWYESKFRDDLSLNYPTTLEDALHRASRFVEMEEEKIALTKKHAPPKSSSTKEKERDKDEHYEPRQHFDTSYKEE